MALQQTLVLVKPDGVARGLTGEVIKRIEQRGLKIVALKLVKIDMDHAKKHYREDIIERHSEKVRNMLLDFIQGKPIVAMIIEGVDAIENTRKLTGATESRLALPGTIRGDFSHMSYAHADETEVPVKNIIHSSADKEDAKYEIALWFSIDELCDYKRTDEVHVF